MLTRTAENSFWLGRHVERLETLVRLLNVNRSNCFDRQASAETSWMPILNILGERDRYIARCGEPDDLSSELIQDYLVWDRNNPTSIVNVLSNARENAHIIRDSIPQELWEIINDLWVWFQSKTVLRLYHQDRYSFYERIRQYVYLFYGVSQDMVYRDSLYYLFELGRWIERSNQSARTVNTVVPRFTDITVNDAQHEGTLNWHTLLKYFSCIDAFRKSSIGNRVEESILNYVLFESQSPRSMLHCLEEIKVTLAMIERLERRNFELTNLEGLVNTVKHLQKEIDQGVSYSHVNHFLEQVLLLTDNITEIMGGLIFYAASPTLTPIDSMRE